MQGIKDAFLPHAAGADRRGEPGEDGRGAGGGSAGSDRDGERTAVCDCRVFAPEVFCLNGPRPRCSNEETFRFGSCVAQCGTQATAR